MGTVFNHLFQCDFYDGKSAPNSCEQGSSWRSTRPVIGRQTALWRMRIGLIGYARVSTGGQSVQRQVDELRKAGCAEILEETASGADRSRPVLAALLRRIRRGETLVVVKLDRLARSP